MESKSIVLKQNFLKIRVSEGQAIPLSAFRLLLAISTVFGASKPRFLFNLMTKQSLRKFLFIPLMRPLSAQDSEQHVVHVTA